MNIVYSQNIKKTFSALLLILLSDSMFAQSRLVINNNGYIIIDNSAYLVIDNPNANAISILGAGGNIVSEAETDVIKWNIGTTTGIYNVPWTTISGVKIPLSINKVTAGIGVAANFILSTWETTDLGDMNLPWPTLVTNMNLPSTTNGSLFVVDRFWHIDALSYFAKPNVNLIINYDSAANEIEGSNTITETNLLAQRFNTSIGSWETASPFGINDSGNDRVIGIVVPAADFFEDWILVDIINVLPVKLTNFEVNCELENVAINWTTQSEMNNDFFIIEKSYDTNVFFELTTIQGNGNSNDINLYSVIDANTSSGIIYYRLKQVDFNGVITTYPVVALTCNSNEFLVTRHMLHQNQLSFEINTEKNEEVSIYLFDNRGRVILNKNHSLVNGSNPILLGNINLSEGIYLLSIIRDDELHSIKLIRR